jgi:6,7-dimethyl-8-ribityllumazine synthase
MDTHTHECMHVCVCVCVCVGLLPVSLEGNKPLKSVISSTDNGKRERERERWREGGGKF